ncbi:MAG: bifunctional diaminohydroxyphosphoribosylaminopyrimidine deaminase/5-amino-6-(5-phosphoribosylamino)uracil reductase RibD [Bacteroidia bacterium]
MNLHEQYMHRCLQLAELGLGHVAPNPMVGCVIVHNGKIIGEGYHHEFGQPHAEVNAINSVKDQSLLEESTLYVNLEPCSHHGKTPPCADLIIGKKIPKVVIGCTDTFEKVSGRGIEKLKNAGVDVTANILENESLELNKRFFTYHNKKRPYIILKWAQSADDFIASNNYDVKDIDDRNVQWISNPLSRILVHKWRSEEQAIMIGTNTAFKDNPKLNVREWEGQNPMRIVLDKNLRLPEGLNIFKKDIPTIVFTEQKEKSESNLQYIKINFDDALNEVMLHLHQLQIQSMIVEGGSELLNSFIKENLWDEARIFTGDQFLVEGIKAPHIHGVIDERMKISNDELSIILNKG